MMLGLLSLPNYTLTQTQFTKYQAGNSSQPDSSPVEEFETAVPLEAKVERRPIPFELAGQGISLDLRLLMGRQWLKLVRSVGNFNQAYIARYPIALPNPSLKEDAPKCAHQEVWQTFAAVAGRRMDGYNLYRYLKESNTHHAYDGISMSDDDIPISEANKSAIDTSGS